jgi:uncharacterized membrane protein
LRILLAALRAVLVLGYPAAVYLGITHLEPRTLGLVMLGLLLPNLALRLASAPPEQRRAVLKLPLALIVLVGVGAALAEPRFYMVLPALVNLTLLANFAASLRGPVSLVERYARLQDPDLPEGGPAYCRKVTIAWCWFFVVNAAVCAGLAVAAPVAWWALYTGVLAYILIGLGFTIEFLVRKRVFQRFGDTLPDRLLARLLRRA